MTKIRLAAFAAAIVAAAMSIGSAGASTRTSAQTVDLSTDQAVVSYLTSLGIDPTGVVIQRGALNYAGPSCPGAAWTCTTSTNVVQVAQPGGQNQVACGAGASAIPDSYLTSDLTDAQVSQLVSSTASAPLLSGCTAVQAGGAQTNTTRCVVHDGSALQPCVIMQPATGASNRAFVLQIDDQSTGSSQDATQTASIRQDATGDAQNFVHVIQSIELSTKTGTNQTQEGHQLTCALQKSESGNEFSQVIQSIAEKEQAQGPPTQQQNVEARSKMCDPGFAENLAFTTSTANTFASVEQDSGSGALESHVNQSHNLDARATNASAPSASQTQGNSAGGIQGKVFQDSLGTAKSFGVLNEDQNLAADSPTITQHQFGPLTCCSTQSSNPNDNVKIDETSSQRAVSSPLPLGDLSTATPNPFAQQQTVLEGDFVTSGDGQITQKGKQNEGSATFSCPPDGFSTGGEEGETAICSLTTVGFNGVFGPPVPD
jgi:hypothetical protein